jgi:hypothetical protein
MIKVAMDADLRRDGHIGRPPHRKRPLVSCRAFLAPLVEAVPVELRHLVPRDAGQPMDAVRVLADEVLEEAELDQLGQGLVRVGGPQRLEVETVRGGFCASSACREWRNKRLTGG